MSFSRKDNSMIHVTILLSALPFESEIIKTILKEKKVINSSKSWVSGYLGKHHILIAHSGVGGERCKNALGALLNEYPHAEVLFLGTAGALDSPVNIGDVVVANTPISWKSPENEKSMRKMVFGATSPVHDSCGIERGNDSYSFCIFRGSVATWGEPVIDKTVKSWLSSVSGATCVDMETGYGAQLCKKRNVPFLAVRGISDMPDDEKIYKNSHVVQAVWNATIVALEALSSPVPVSMWPVKYL